MRLAAALAFSSSLLVLAGQAQAQENYDATNLRLSRFVGVVQIETANVDQITVEYDQGEDLVDPARFEVEDDTLIVRQLARRTRTSCRAQGDEMTLEVDRGGYHPIADYGRLVVRLPANAGVEIGGGAVQGEIGNIRELELGINSCADFSVGDVAEDAEIAINGSGDVRIGAIGGHLEIAMNGSGDVTTGAVASGLETAINGSGDVEVASVSGSIEAAINGSGDVSVLGGEVSRIEAAIMGSGDVRFEGTAGEVELAAFGSGDVYVNQVTGSINSSAFGSGRVHVGQQ